MAHIGSFVPASFAQMTVFDKVLTKMGASDAILQGMSTYYLELSEMKQIMTLAT